MLSRGFVSIVLCNYAAHGANAEQHLERVKSSIVVANSSPTLVERICVAEIAIFIVVVRIIHSIGQC